MRNCGRGVEHNGREGENHSLLCRNDQSSLFMIRYSLPLNDLRMDRWP
jgi:hypothetical protein